MPADRSVPMTRRDRLVSLAQSFAILVAVAAVAIAATQAGIADLTGNSLWVVVPSVLLMTANLERLRRRALRAASR